MTTLRKKSLFFLREIIIIGLIIAVAFIASRPINTWLGQRAIAEVQLEDLSYEVALQKSQDEGKPLMFEFSAIWCSSCRKLDKQVLAEATVHEKIRSDYIFARLDYDSSEDRKIFDQFGIKGFPTIIIMSSDRSTARTLATTFDPNQFLQQL